MKKIARKIARTVPVLSPFLLLLPTAGSAQPLNRSIYVPVSLRVCEHLDDALLYVDDQRIGYLPIQRVFLFTYYPSLGRIEPKATELRVEGRREDGSRFVARLAVTASGIYTADEQVDLDPGVLGKLRYKIDVRYKKTDLRLQCDTICSPAPPPLAPAVEIEVETAADDVERERSDR